jgi:hypothetical protein
MLQSILNLFIDKITNSNKLQQKILMNNICKNILLFSPLIKYVGVIDRDGKLIAGLCKKDYLLTLINNSFPPPFLLDKILPAIDYFNAIIEYDYHNIFQSNLYNYLLIEKNSQNLVIFPITNNGDKYICVFSESNGDIIEVIDKLLLVMI